MIAPDALPGPSTQGIVSRDMRLADVILSHYGKIPEVPVSYAILLWRALLITPPPKILFLQNEP
jgi:hypothetical protein